MALWRLWGGFGWLGLEGAAGVSMEIIQGAGHALAALLEDMRVNHGGGHVGVAQQFLDGADIRAPLQEVRRKAVPEGVRTDQLGQPTK
jgi:hypothetical protein